MCHNTISTTNTTPTPLVMFAQKMCNTFPYNKQKSVSWRSASTLCSCGHYPGTTPPLCNEIECTYCGGKKGHYNFDCWKHAYDCQQAKKNQIHVDSNLAEGGEDERNSSNDNYGGMHW